MINFINCLFLMDFYEPFEEMEANNVCFFSSIVNLWSGFVKTGELSIFFEVNNLNKERKCWRSLAGKLIYFVIKDISSIFRLYSLASFSKLSVAFGLGDGQLELRFLPTNADIEVGDILEVYEEISVKKTLK